MDKKHLEPDLRGQFFILSLYFENINFSLFIV